MWTFPAKTWRAIVPPISAAAILSRKPDRVKTIASSTKPPFQVRKQGRHLVRDSAFLEVAREDRKSHQQQEQVSEDHPVVVHVQHETPQARTDFKGREH